MHEDFPDFHDLPEEDDGGVQEIVVIDGRLTEAKAELHRLNLKRIRNSGWHGAHLYKKRGLEERLQRAREGRTTRGSGAHNGRGTVKSRGGYPTGNVKAKPYEPPHAHELSAAGTLELNFWIVHWTAQELGGTILRLHGVKPVTARTTTSAEVRRR
jgi:hypothetical protein